MLAKQNCLSVTNPDKHFRVMVRKAFRPDKAWTKQSPATRWRKGIAFHVSSGMFNGRRQERFIQKQAR